MKVILTKDVAGLGRAGEVKEVSEGHARNFLLSKYLALPATSSALEQLQKQEQEKQAKIARDHDKALKLKQRLEGKTFEVKGKAQGQNLFAALHEKDIAQALMSSGVEISEDAIILNSPLKNLGIHEVEIKLNPLIKAKIRLEVKAT